MKIRKAIKMAVAGAVVALPVSVVMAMGGAHTGPLTIHGQWSVDTTSSTGLNVACPAGFTCGAASVTDTGFVQRTITDLNSGNQFVQTIISEGGTTGASFSNMGTGGFFGDENFIMLNGAGGISAQSQIQDTTAGAGDFTSKVNLNTGTEFSTMQSTAVAGSMGDGSMVELQQGIIDTGSEFQSQFAFDHGMVMGSEGGGKFAVIGLDDFANDTPNNFSGTFKFQRKDIENNTGTAASTFPQQKMDIAMKLDPADIVQDFTVSTRSGAATGNGTVFPNGGTPVTVSGGDSIYQMDLGQSVTGAGEFGMTDFQNKTSGNTGKVQSLTSSAIPFNTVTDDLDNTTLMFESFDPFAP